MRIINIVPDVLPVRMGVWLPGVYVSTALLKNHQVQTEIWFPGNDHAQNFYAATAISLKNTGISYLEQLIIERKLNPENDIIVTNSPWTFQHKWGYHLAKKGFKWVCMPHGNFQKWALHHKWWKKLPYFYLLVKPMLQKVALIRASGFQEMEEMKKNMPQFNILQIPNGVEMPEGYDGEKDLTVKTFLFMARINFKKRVLQLAEAWLASPLNNNPVYKLVIAGPDDGDLEKLMPLANKSSNIEYTGSIYGDDKEKWLRKSTFYILPSVLEGFATSVLEAASRACIPIITEGCNFPEIIDAGYAVRTGIEKEDIKKSLIQCMNMGDEAIRNMGNSTAQFIHDNYRMDIIADRIYKVYSGLLATE